MKRFALLFALTLALAVPASAGKTIPSLLTAGCATAEKAEEKKGDFSLLAPPAKVVWAGVKASAWTVKKSAKGAAFVVKKLGHFLF
ncbi:hypothetical protein LCGC14_2284500 [marine sediment metagenome]|uniref:Uncharacterized protein n=1 Tax=marine sediment metagenome TaxID=412755 RepID=A0A0F9CSX8_9ZZZZ